jgi:hypothetical protein
MRSRFVQYLHDIDVLLARQSGLTRAMVLATDRHLAGESTREELAQTAMGQLEAYVALEADASALVVPDALERAHALFAEGFAACAAAQQRLLASLDEGGAPDLNGFEIPALCLRSATEQAYAAAATLAA